MRYLAIDYGDSRTGLAVCDEGEIIASPLKVIEGVGGVIQQIEKIIKEEPKVVEQPPPPPVQRVISAPIPIPPPLAYQSTFKALRKKW